MNKLPANQFNTIIVSLYGGPSVGKSTISHGLMFKLKLAGVNAEYISEYAKDRTWQNDWETLACQPYVTVKQWFRNVRLLGKVRVIVTDSPILIGLAYPGIGSGESFDRWVVDIAGQMNNMNILLVRNADLHPYQQEGRSQTESEAREVDDRIVGMFIKHQIPCTVMQMSGEETVNILYERVMEELQNQDEYGARTLAFEVSSSDDGEG